jgi:hypothetical protein
MLRARSISQIQSERQGHIRTKQGDESKNIRKEIARNRKDQDDLPAVGARCRGSPLLGLEAVLGARCHHCT